MIPRTLKRKAISRREHLYYAPIPFDQTAGRFISLMATHYTGQDGWITNHQLHYKHNDNRMLSLIEKATRGSIYMRALYEMKVGQHSVTRQLIY